VLAYQLRLPRHKVSPFLRLIFFSSQISGDFMGFGGNLTTAI
jgi:hypothetical protein